jgi:hypothetical protein
MKKFAITNTVSGSELGIFEAENEAAALEQMAKEAGYASYKALQKAHPAPQGQIVVRDVERLHRNPTAQGMSDEWQS